MNNICSKIMNSGIRSRDIPSVHIKQLYKDFHIYFTLLNAERLTLNAERLTLNAERLKLNA